MGRFARWWRFNVVGAMGMAVQLSVLAMMSRCVPGRYLWASAVAVEMAVLHNFVWHMRYTWRGRDGLSGWRALWRFHVSNGMVSMVGNVLLMRALVGMAHVPVVVANGLAIMVCSGVNFGLGEAWVFAGTG
jgi:putative flippase GtrA